MFNSPYRLVDAQAALSFMTQQATYIEPQVYEIQYAEIQYPSLIPIDSSGNEWAKSKTFFSLDKVGQAAWFHHLASDIAMADVQRTKYEVNIEMAKGHHRKNVVARHVCRGFPKKVA